MSPNLYEMSCLELTLMLDSSRLMDHTMYIFSLLFLFARLGLAHMARSAYSPVLTGKGFLPSLGPKHQAFAIPITATQFKNKNQAL